MQERITIVTPTYNRENYLRETIDSVLAQTHCCFRYLIIDDGSTDGSRELVAEYPNIDYFYQPNQGEAAATNLGWSMAKTEYFAMVSSDDPMKPDWLERAIEFMDRHSEVLVGYPDWEMIDGSGQHIRDVITYDYLPEKLYGWLHCLPGAGTIIRKSVLPKNYRLRDSSYKYVSDMESWLRLGVLGEMARIPKLLACWRYHDSGVSSSDFSRARAEETLRMAREFYRGNVPVDIKKYEKQSLSRANYLASIFMRKTSIPLAVRFYLASRILQPLDPSSVPNELRRIGVDFATVRNLWDRFRSR